MIQIRNFRKEYDKFVAVRSLSFEIPKGDIFGFIGPNGAGKTTTIRFLVTLMPATSGTASVAGHDVVKDVQEVRRSIGYMPDSFGVYNGMRVWEFLDFFAVAYGVRRSVRTRLLFRLRVTSHMPESDALRESVPVLRRDTRIETFDYDVNILLAARRSCRLPSDLRPSRSRAAFLKVANASEVRTLVLGNDVAALVDCCDGRATLAEIATTVARSLDHGDGAETWALETLENLFARGLLDLRQGTG